MIRALTAAELDALRARTPNLVEVDIDGEGLVCQRPIDAAAFDRWYEQHRQSVADAAENLVARHLVHPSLSELDALRRRAPLVDTDLQDELLGVAGKPPEKTVVFEDELTEDVDDIVLERAGLPPDVAMGIARDVAAQHHKAKIVVAPKTLDWNTRTFACVVVTPPSSAIVPVQRAKGAEYSAALRTMTAACTAWCSEGDPAATFAKYPALVVFVLGETIAAVGGAGRARRRAFRGGNAPRAGG